MFYAIHEGRKHIEHCLRDAGCRTWTIKESSSDINVKIADEPEAPDQKDQKTATYMGTKLVITGSGSVL